MPQKGRGSRGQESCRGGEVAQSLIVKDIDAGDAGGEIARGVVS